MYIYVYIYIEKQNGKKKWKTKVIKGKKLKIFKYSEHVSY